MPFIIPALAIFAAIFIIGTAAGAYFYRMALDPQVIKKNKEKSKEERSLPFERDREWIQKIKKYDVWMQTFDGLLLHGTAVENPEISSGSGAKWAILFHGYSADGEAMGCMGKHFYERGFCVLMPDARGFGRSQGRYCGMGWHDRLDAVGWIQYLKNHYQEPQIILYGVSMGGATVMMAAGEKLPQNVRAIVEDCGYSSIKKELRYDLRKIFRLPAFPILNFTSMITSIRAGYSLRKDGSCVKQLAHSHTPIMFIHGEEDTFVPAAMLKEVYRAAPGPKEKFTVKGAGHGMSAWTDPKKYWMNVFGFLERYLV